MTSRAGPPKPPHAPRGHRSNNPPRASDTGRASESQSPPRTRSSNEAARRPRPAPALPQPVLADGAHAFFAPCPRGLEDVLVEELQELGLGSPQTVPGGVSFSGTWADAYRANLHSRIASRILWRIAEAPYRHEGDIFKLAADQPWERWFDIENTLRVDVTASRSPLRSLEFTTLRIKDAICDHFRRLCGERPSIDTVQPDVRVVAYVNSDAVVLYLDTSGEPLFKRGWRLDGGSAPLRENLAAGILRLAGWQPGEALFDPMCGSGTLIVEAMQRQLGLAPGLQRRFGFERLKNFNALLWQEIRDQAKAAERPLGAVPADSGPDDIASILPLHASDISGDALQLTRENLIRAGLSEDWAFAIAPKQVDARHVRAPAPTGVLITNPPYGERMAVRAAASPEVFFKEFGDTLKQRFAGWRCYILSSDLKLQSSLHLAPTKRIVLYNGALECRLFEFRMHAGKSAPPVQAAAAIGQPDQAN